MINKYKLKDYWWIFLILAVAAIITIYSSFFYNPVEFKITEDGIETNEIYLISANPNEIGGPISLFCKNDFDCYYEYIKKEDLTIEWLNEKCEQIIDFTEYSCEDYIVEVIER